MVPLYYGEPTGYKSKVRTRVRIEGEGEGGWGLTGSSSGWGCE
jgi:hypothetical protein